jgi:multidrug efflux system membrane fusion protein
MSAPRNTLLLTSLSVFCLVLWGCKGDPRPADGAGAPPAPEVTVAAARTQPMSAQEEFPGRLEAVDKVEVRARVSGYIEAVHFRQGEDVRRGDLLVSIDPRPYQARLQRAEGDLAALQSRIELARLELARAERLLASQATTQRDLDERVARLKDLEASARSAQASVEAARLDLSFTRVTAPISGRAGRFDITAGNLVQAESPEPPVLTTIVSMNPLYVSFDVDEATFVRFGLDAAARRRWPVSFALTGESGFPRQATLQFVDNRVDPGTGSVHVRAVVANSDARLTPGLFARVRLSDPAGAVPAVVVPERAIGTDQDRRFVLVVGADRKAQHRNVKVGGAEGGMRIVRDGLREGEQVVVNGLMRVRPGQLVDVKPEPAPAAAGR